MATITAKALILAALILAVFLCLTCADSRSTKDVAATSGPGYLDLMSPEFHWERTSASPTPIRIPFRAGSPLLAEGWAEDNHDLEGESCVLSTGPSTRIYLPFWPGRQGKVKIRLLVHVIGAYKCEDRPQIVVSLNGKKLVSRPSEECWFPLDLVVSASKFHQGENEMALTVKPSKEGETASAESFRMAISRLELTLPRIKAGLMLGRIQQQALVSTEPLTIDLPAHLPEGAELHYSVALMPWFTPVSERSVTSRISVKALPGEPEGPVCANDHRVGTDLLTITAKAAGSHWRHNRLPLTALAGKKVRLQLTAETAESSASPPSLHAWGSLVLTWPGDDGDEPRSLESNGPYNVLVILADTLRADRLGTGGAARRLTPHLDRFSRRAITFQDTVAQASATYPSMCSMFTSNYYTRISQWAQKGHLPPTIRVMGEIFSSNGFHTVGIVGNPLLRPEAGFARGFHCYDNSLIFRPATMINQQFLQWLPMLSGTTFFAYLHYMDIHTPYGSPDFPKPKVFRSGRLKGQDWAGGLTPVVREFIEHGNCSLDQHDRATLSAQYDEGIRFWDQQLGHLLSELENHGILSNTIVVVIADHGEEFFEHGLVNHGQSLYRELVHVPALILFPPGSGIGQPQQITQPIELLDILPTLYDFLKVPLTEGYQGISRLPLLHHSSGTDQRPQTNSNLPRLFETRRRNWVKPPYNDFLYGIHYGRWKLVQNRDTDESQLFDLVNDPEEQENLAKDKTDTVMELQRLVNTALKPEKTDSATDILDRREREALKALGYIQ